MQENKIIIFDWGGVIESHREGEYNIYNAIESIVKRLTDNKITGDIIHSWESCNFISKDHMISETSNIDDIKLWFNNIKNKFNLECTFEDFVQVYKEEYMKVYFYKDVVEYAHSLKKKCKIGILSNLGYLDKERIDKQVHLNMFDYIWLSFELECRKPDAIIYEKVEKDIEYDKSNILFIDDKKENIEAASECGWNTCLAYGYELDKIKKGVEEFLQN